MVQKRTKEKTHELIINDHVPFVDPNDYDISDFESINPNDYFITSGDAVVKATHLDKDMWKLAGQARQKFRLSDNKKHQEFVKHLWIAAGKCRTLLSMLKRIRGTHIFLEISWDNNTLMMQAKDPRGYVK